MPSIPMKEYKKNKGINLSETICRSVAFCCFSRISGDFYFSGGCGQHCGGIKHQPFMGGAELSYAYQPAAFLI